MADSEFDDDDEYDHFDRLHVTWFAVPPLYVMRTVERCPACGKAMHVYTLGVSAFHERNDPKVTGLFHFLRSVESLPKPVLELLARKCPRYTRDQEEPSGIPYFMNHCQCGAKLDDDYLHGDVGAAFWPDTPDGYAAIQLFELPIDDPIPIVSSFAIGGDEFLRFDRVKPWAEL